MSIRSNPTPAEWGVLLLRVSLGVMFLAHGVLLKIVTFGPAGTAQYFASIGLPGALAYLTIAAEAVGGSMLVLGIQTRWVAPALSPILISALIFVHIGNGWVFSAPNGGWEYPAYLLVLCVVQALIGDGPFALSPSRSLAAHVAGAARPAATR